MSYMQGETQYQYVDHPQDTDNQSASVLREVDEHIAQYADDEDKKDEFQVRRSWYTSLKNVSPELFEAIDTCVEEAYERIDVNVEKIKYPDDGDESMKECYCSVKRRTGQIRKTADAPDNERILYSNALHLLEELGKLSSIDAGHTKAWVLAEADFEELDRYRRVFSQLDAGQD